MLLNIKLWDLNLVFKDSPLLNGLLTELPLNITEEELKTLLYNGLKRRLALQLLKNHLLKMLMLWLKLIKLSEFSSELKILMLTKPFWIYPKLSMMSLSLMSSLLMSDLTLKPLKTVLFFSDNSMNPKLLMMENSLLKKFPAGSPWTLYPLLWISINPLPKKFSEITSLVFSY